MNINVTSFKVEFRRSDFIRFTMNTIEREKTDSYPTYYVISRDEIPLVLDCMRGESKFNPLFQDGQYKIAFYSAEIYALEMYSENVKEYHFVLPFKTMWELQTNLQKWYEQPQVFTYELSKDQLDFIRFENRNQVKWNYQDVTNGKWDNFKYTEWVEYAIIPRVLADCKRQPELKSNLARLTKIAANHSLFGEKVFVDLSFDSWNDAKNENEPASYYFNIHTQDNKRIMNGGIIAHKRNDGSVEYSTHT